jgi:hypothetical protein
MLILTEPVSIPIHMKLNSNFSITQDGDVADGGWAYMTLSLRLITRLHRFQYSA